VVARELKMGLDKRRWTWLPWGRSRIASKAARRMRPVLEPLEPRLVLDGQSLMITELMAVNSFTLADEDGDFPDWIEVYNPTDAAVDLQGWHLTDNAHDLTKWVFPSHVLAPDQYVVVFASDKDRATPGMPLHTNFKLTSDGEYLALVEPDGTTIADEFSPGFPEQSTDVSYGYTFSSSMLLSEGAELTYLVPTADEAALGNAWTAPDFDDSNWNGSNVFDRVLITEIGTTTPSDFVEIQNVSEETVDTSGWVVALQHGYMVSIDNVHPILWQLPDSMAPGEILYRNDSTWGSDIVWASRGPNWAMLIDDEGHVVDFIPWGSYSAEDLASLDVTINGFPITVGDAWSGASFNPLGIQSGKSFQRQGTSDGNTAGDWAITSETMGAQNAALPVPFSAKCYTGIGYGTGSPGLEEAIRTDVAAAMHGLNASLWTRIRFDAPDPSTIDRLILQMKHNDGFVAYLNGQPIASRNAPASPQWNSTATAPRSLAESLIYEEINVSQHLDALLPGTNVLAIHALNVSAHDGDFLMLPRLVATSHQAQSQYFHSPTPGGPNSAGFVVINEIHYDPEDNSQHVEFIELLNTTAHPIDLSGWRFDDGVRFTFPQGTVIPGADYLVVAEDPAAVQARFGVSALGPWTGRLDNDGETIVLVNELEQLQDEVSYRSTFPWPIAARGDGSSMELIHPSLDNDLGGSWRPSGYQTLTLPGQPIDPADAAPTPGRLNSVFSSQVPPQIRQVAHQPQQPPTGEAVVVTAKVTDPNGVAEVSLAYQLVLPGDYIPAFLPLSHGTLLSDPYREFDRNPAYDDPANWITVVMRDDGAGADVVAGDDVYTASIPPQPANRTLVRYRITATDLDDVSDGAPYRDDPSMNFAYYVYDGVPDYTAQTRSVHPDGPGHVYPSELLTSLPVYTLIARAGDLEDCIGYNSGDQISRSNDGARRRFNWEGTFVYDGVVYDHVLYRLRQHNDRYGLHGKRSMRFRFPKGHYFQAYDNYGNPYPTQWRTLNTGKMFDNKDVGNFGLTETINNNLWNLVGVPAPWMHTFHFRVVDATEEAPAGIDGQHNGDFWGMFLAVEDYDARFLDAHGLADGNLYKLKNGIFDGNRLKRYQGHDSVADDSDFQNIHNYLRPGQPDTWLNAYVNYDRWNWYHAVVEAVRHYDVRPADSHLKNRAWYFEPYEGSPYGRLWTLPHDSDASWGPNWNAGEDYSKSAIFGGTGKPAFKQQYRNTIREFRDLVWTEEVIRQMIDDLAAFVIDFSQADRDRWRNAPAAAGYQDFGPIEAKIQDMKNFAFVGWTEPWPGLGPAVPAGGRAAHLDSLADAEGDATSIPDTPTIVSTSAAGFPIDALSFRCSPFSDPQGHGTFAAMEWRIGEISDPDAPFDPTRPRIYEFNPLWESGELTTFSDTVTIPGGALEVGHTYRVRVRMKDTTNRWSHWSEPVELTTAAPLTPVWDALKITEVQYHPHDPAPAELAVDPNLLADDFEFIELCNTGTTTLDLIGFELTDGIEFAFTADGVTVLDPGQYVVLVKDPVAFEARYGAGSNVAGTFGGNLSNAGERITLLDPFGRTVLDFEYGDDDPWPGRADGKGAALEVLDTGGDYADANNWRSSIRFGGTPGADPAEPTGVLVNEVLTHTDWPQVDAVELHNTTDQPIDVGGWYLSDDWGWASSARNGDYRKFRIPDGTEIPAGGYVVFYEGHYEDGQLRFDPQSEFGGFEEGDFALSGAEGDDVWLMEADAAGKLTRFADHVQFGAALCGEPFGRWPDGQGDLYPMPGETLGVANEGPRLGSVIISEVMYHPADGGAEYVELVNRTDATVSLFDPQYPAHTWQFAGIDFEFPPDVEIPPGGVVLVVPSTPAWFAATYDVPAGVQVFGPYGGVLDNGGERLRLLRPDQPPAEAPHFVPYVLEDEVRYDDEGPWPGEADGWGDSLHRRQTGLWGNDSTHWIAATATPGRLSWTTNPEVVGRYVFYNHSAFDGGDPQPNIDDDDAIAPDKTALLPGGEATFDHVTSYSRGINGIMIDLVDPAGAISQDDFRFHVGNDNDLVHWTKAPPPADFSVRKGDGVDGSDRVTFVWDDDTIRNQWLQVTVLGTNLGLDEDDVFYFGNAVAESGNSQTDARVTVIDLLLTRNNRRSFLDPAERDSRYDYNRDRRVNITDVLLARNHQTSFLDALELIHPPTAPWASASAAPAEGPLSQATGASSDPWTWLYEVEPIRSLHRLSDKSDTAAEAVDRLLATYLPEA